jgi:hypothetical protein
LPSLSGSGPAARPAPDLVGGWEGADGGGGGMGRGWWGGGAWGGMGGVRVRRSESRYGGYAGRAKLRLLSRGRWHGGGGPGRIPAGAGPAPPALIASIGSCPPPPPPAAPPLGPPPTPTGPARLGPARRQHAPHVPEGGGGNGGGGGGGGIYYVLNITIIFADRLHLRAGLLGRALAGLYPGCFSQKVGLGA